VAAEAQRQVGQALVGQALEFLSTAHPLRAT